MKDNFYSHWQRNKKRYDHDWDRMHFDDVNHPKNLNKKRDFNSPYGYINQDHQDQNYYDKEFRNMNYDNRTQDQQKQQYFQKQNRWSGWDNSEKMSDRNWWDKTTDEVAGWFGDDDAQRRRRLDKVRGPHRGKGPKGYERSDDRIREDVSDRFFDDPYIDASDISIRVESKDVILEGTVESKEAKRRAEYLAESIRGVKDVENRLKINRSNQNYRGSSDYRNRY
jgi:osmotically-inducible protein OsmY